MLHFWSLIIRLNRIRWLEEEYLEWWISPNTGAKPPTAYSNGRTRMNKQQGPVVPPPRPSRAPPLPRPTRRRLIRANKLFEIITIIIIIIIITTFHRVLSFSQMTLGLNLVFFYLFVCFLPHTSQKKKN
jgi:hypothetical protein